ncbi:MAG: Hsp33 family molecular chaperone [Rhizobiales bacterium 62-17]|nr:Hsp33 family molecular chaperone [Hyphomicrobiales bacterium]OJY00418.1 MAG: Hsp33 family molecular chaperone [Rhizobiales bacterium 62-17]
MQAGPMNEVQPASRPVSDTVNDDRVLPYAVAPLDARGRLVRLGPALDDLLRNHAYPPEVARAVGEAAALNVLLGSALTFEGRFQLQTRTDGIIDMLVVDFDSPDRIRAFARFDAARLDAARAAGEATPAALLGRGHLAFTVDRGPSTQRYQGVVALDGQGLEAAAHQYFQQSEQIPTLVRLAVGEVVNGANEPSAWRAGGLIVQFLPDSPERRRMADLDPGDAPEGAAKPEALEDDAWLEAKALAGSVEDHELVDPALSSERLLYRLFNQRGVTVFEPQEIRHACRCSRDSIATMLKSFTPQERRDMVADDGLISVTCEFCGVRRSFEPAEVEPEQSPE